ncbi:hypothetical protein BH10CHL1_BH10CHL1_47630 [soil metagenome]
MPTFAEQLTQYMKRVGITDAELARRIGVQRQTIFRWKEGTVGRPRVREDVLKCAESLRLTAEERDQLLVAAGFAPEQPILFAPTANLPVDAPISQPLPIHTAEVSQPEFVPTATSGRELQTSSRPQAHSLHLARQWLLPLGLLSGLLILLVGGTWLYRGSRQIQPGAVSNVLSTPPLNTAPGATPLKAPGGIVVAQFSTVLDYPRYDVAKRIQEAVDAELSQTELSSTTVLIWPQNILTKQSAEAVSQSTQAALVIWGEYDSGRVVVQFTMQNKLNDQHEIAIANPDELNSTINVQVKQEVRLLALLTLGKVYWNEQRYDKANIAFNQALALKPQEIDTQATLYFNLGYLATKLNEKQPSLRAYGQAIDAYTRVIGIKPDWENALYNRGTAYIDQSRLFAANAVEITKTLDAALVDLSQVISNHPTRNDAYLNRGIAHYERQGIGDTQAAIEDFDQVIALAPNRYEGYYNRGLTRIRGNLASWTTDLTQTLTLTPTYSPAFDALCWGYALAQDPQRALPFCNKSIELEEQQHTTKAGRVSRGIVYAELGRYADALNDLDVHRAWLASLQPATQYERMNGKKLETWIVALQQNTDPFGKATLDALR